MTTHEKLIAHTLRALDAADQEIAQPQRTRAAATLERILASDPDAPAPTTAPSSRPRRGAHRLVLAGGGVVAAAAAVVAFPLLSDQGGAFASWSAEPVELTGEERRAAVDACLVLQGNDGGELAFDPRSGASVLVAEARGGWSYVMYTVESSSGRELQGSCLVPDGLVADPRTGEGGFFGSLGPADESAGRTPAPDVVRQDSYGVGSVDDEAFVFAEGRVGSEVLGIEVTTPGGQQVEASIANGRWAAWWPAGDASLDNPEITGAPTYEVTLRDGTVLDGVRAR